MSVGAVTVIGGLIYSVLISLGIVHWQKPTTPQEMYEVQTYMMYFGTIPLVLSFFLILNGAYRALKRKKIFVRGF